MINVAILENENMQDIYLNVINKINNINVKYAKNLNKQKKDYDLYIIFLSIENYFLDEKDLLKSFEKNVIIFLERYNTKFLWNITNTFNPIDVILTTIPNEIIIERINNIIKKIESEVI